VNGFDDRDHFAALDEMFSRIFGPHGLFTGCTPDQFAAYRDGREAKRANRPAAVPIKFMAQDLARWWCAGYDGR